ncbi:MAG: hypothetical protein Tsb009_22690 [Planctomycetaceae bacterium]
MLEFLLAFPIALTFLLAIVEFGIILGSARHLEMAAYEGAKLAAEMEPVELENGLDNVRERVNRSLATSGLGQAVGVEIRHNVPGVSHSHQTWQSVDTLPGGNPPLPQNSHVAAVQCTVRVPLSKMGPDLLPFIGFTLKKRYATATKTLPYSR